MNTDRQQHRHWLLIASVLLVGLGWPLRLYALPAAHGGGTPRLVNQVAEPYRLWLWTEPGPLRVGEAHVTIAIEETTVETTTVEAAQGPLTVQLLLVPQDETHPTLTLDVPHQPRLLQTYLAQDYYARDFTLPVAGEWQGTVRINGPAGRAEVPFAFTVAIPQRISWTMAGWGIFAVVALLGLIWARRGSSP